MLMPSADETSSPGEASSPPPSDTAQGAVIASAQFDTLADNELSGDTLDSASLPDPDEGSTMFMPTDQTPTDAIHPAPPSDEGATMFMPSADETSSPGEASSPPPSDTAQGAVIASAQFDTLADDELSGDTLDSASPPDPDEGSTMFMPEVDKTTDHNTILETEPAIPNEGMTIDLPPAKAPEQANSDLEDDGQTTAMPLDTGLSLGGATLAISQAPAPDTSAAATPQNSNAAGADLIPAMMTEPMGDTDKAVSPQAQTIDAGLAMITVKIGHVLQSRYQLDKVLGRGGFGAAFLAEDIKLKRACVVKQMLTPKDISPSKLAKHRANFEREASLLVQLNQPGHANIPEIYDYFFEDDDSYLVMKYIEGRNLSGVLSEQQGKILWRQAARYAIDICSALNYMHTTSEEPVMHRDIKPANIILGDDGRVWLIDFGLAKAEDIQGSADNIQATQASGSLGYTPLEQWFGEAVPASDVYAVGATLHHLVTGLSPLDAYEGQFNIEKIHDLHGQFTSIRKVDRKLPKRLEEALNQAVADQPEDRPTPLQFQQQLEVIVSGAKDAALYTFKSGKSAYTVEQLVDLCDINRQEAITYLYYGDFERWFLLINRNDLAESAQQAVKENPDNQKTGLERFLKLILPNLVTRRLVKTGWGLVRLTAQFIAILFIVVLLVAFVGSWGLGALLQESIGGTAWDFSTLTLETNPTPQPENANHYDELYVVDTFTGLAGAYLDDIQVDIKAQDKMNIKGTWSGIPLDLGTTIRMGVTTPRLNVTELNQIPLFFVGTNISNGLNNGINTVITQGPIDVMQLIVKDDDIVFWVTESDDPNRPAFATATPAPTATPLPTPTPTPVPFTLVVLFNDLDQDIVLKVAGPIWSDTINIPARESKVIEPPGGIYTYTVLDPARQEPLAQGTKEWFRDKAYRLSLNMQDLTLSEE